MTSAWSQLEQMLTCAICLDKFKNPRLLPCQHSFCGDTCMNGLVDYARRQIKCPECRAEHRIPYQGIESLPSNVTLIRFLELHSRITGEEPEPIPTFMEKCSICGEKVDGVQRCSHCEKKVCPECKEAHIDLLRREVTRINGQSKRCLSKMQEFKETLEKSEERLSANKRSICREIEESSRRLFEDLQSKQKRLIDEVNVFVEQEQKTIDKLKVAIVDELEIIESNSRLADEKVSSNKYPWTDVELSEMKEIYAKAMEFVRLFDPEIGDFTRKIRFTLIPEFEVMRRRICELGELKFGESACSLIASSFQYCNATGSVALELFNVANAQAAASASNATGSAGYGLSHSNSNTNLVSGGGISNQASTMLELPSMQNALMRSQSDHRLASQFQQRLKQQQQEANKNGRYGVTTGRDFETDALRSRYAPPRSTASSKDYSSDLATRDWPRPSDNDAPDSFGSSFHFKSAYLRRRAEKERQQLGSYGGGYNDDDDDLNSEASYSTMNSSGRNVRFNDPSSELVNKQQQPKLFDTKEVEHGPLSGVPKLEVSIYLQGRLLQMVAKAIVDKKLAEEEGKRDKDLVDSARQAMSKANSERNKQKQLSEDELEKQNRANKELSTSVSGQTASSNNDNSNLTEQTIQRNEQRLSVYGSRDSLRHSPTPTADLNSSSSTVVEVEPASRANREQQQQQPATPPTPETPTTSSGGRRSLYGQAVNEKSKRQLSSALQDAASYTTRRNRATTNSSIDGDQTPDASTGSSSSGARTKRTLRSSGRSLSKQSSIEQQQSLDSNGCSTGTTQRRRRTLARASSSSQQSIETTNGQQVQTNSNASTAYQTVTPESSQSKNYATGSGGHSDNLQTSNQESLTADRRRTEPHFSNERNVSKVTDQTSTTTDDDDVDEEANRKSISRPYSAGSMVDRARSYAGRGSLGASGSSSRKSRNDSDNDDDDDGDTNNNNSNDDDDAESGEYGRNAGNRRSRELLPNAVNKLLDRSAQIRRDSQEQRSRGDSPQRTTPRSSAIQGTSASNSKDYSSPSQSSYYSSSATTAGRASGGYSSPSGSPATSTAAISSAARQRLAYQRSQSIRDSQQQLDDETTNSNNSIYTTASSSGRKSSFEDDSANNSSSIAGSRKLSGNSTDRTLTSDINTNRSSYSRRDSSGENSSQPAYQNRYLARSRTSAALSSNRSQEPTDSGADSIGERPSESAARSYLSSRDRFLQSASTLSGGSQTTANTSGAGSSLYSRSGSSAVVSPSAYRSISNLGQYRHHPTSQAYYSDNSPFIEFDDEDDEYSAYFPSGFKTHSEYLRNKFSRRNSSNSSSSSALLRSRSSHSAFARDSNDEDVELDDDERASERSNLSSGLPGFNQQYSSISSKRMSLVNASLDSQTSFGSSGSGSRNAYSNKKRLLFKLGSRGSEAGNFTWPRGVAVGIGGSRGREIVVADSSNHRVQIFDSMGKFLNEFGSYGSAEGEFDCLAGVAINRVDKNYVVSDRYNHRIQIFNISGRFVRAFGEMGTGNGKFNLPWGVACDTSGLIYVCDKENHRIQVFDSDGMYLNKFGFYGNGTGQLQHPHYIAVGLGKVIITDTNNHRVQVFDLNGKIINSFGKEGSDEGQFKFPRGVAMDERGYIVVGDSGNNRLQIFAPDGSFIKSIGTWGSGEGEFKGIEGVAVDNNNNILVCDRENHRIQVF